MSTHNSKKLSILSNEYKFKLFIGYCIGIHLLISVFATYTQITHMLIFNICSILIYIGCLFLISKKQELIIYTSFTEIIIHSFVSVILIGNDFGFSMYFIALIPLSFHLLNAIKTKKYLQKAFIISCISFMLFAACYIISFTHKPIYTSDLLDTHKPYVYLINMLITFLALLAFSILFLIEIDNTCKSLYDKNQELDMLVNTDALTGLYNRRTMTIHVQNMYKDYHETKSPFSLVICDIDDFKKVNDTYGHDAGDKVIKAISSILSIYTRGLDFVCRWGGEEFVIFFRDIDNATAHTMTENIRQKIEETEFDLGETKIKLTMTFGISSADETDDYNELFNLADNRMYEGKKSGKNKVV